MNVNNMSVLLLFLWYFYEGFYVLDGYLRKLCVLQHCDKYARFAFKYACKEDMLS